MKKYFKPLALGLALTLFALPVFAGKFIGGGMGATFNGGTITNPLLLPNGTVNVPGLAFVDAPGTGLSRSAGDNLTLRTEEATGSWVFRFSGSNSAAVALNRTATSPTIHSGGIYLSGVDTFGFGTSITEDAAFIRDSAGVIAQRLSTAAMEFQVYGTYTDASNYERYVIRSALGDYVVGTEAAGTGTLRNVSLVGAQILFPDGLLATPALSFASDPDSGIQWVQADVYNLVAGGAAALTIRSGNTVSIGGLVNAPTWSKGTLKGIHLDVTEGLSWAKASNNADDDTTLNRLSAGILRQYSIDTAQPQTYEVFNTYTDDSNGEWGSLGWNDTADMLVLATEANGTGTVRNMAITGGQLTIGVAELGSSHVEIHSVGDPFNVTGGQLGLKSTEAWAIDLGGKLTFSGLIDVGVTGTFGSIAGRKSTATQAGGGGYLEFVTQTTGSVQTIAMHISDGQDIGIGTSTPLSRVHVAEPTDGGDDDVQNQIQGLLKLANVSLGVLPDGSDTSNIIDTAPAADWPSGDGDVTVDDDTGIKRKGVNSLGIAWTSDASNGDGTANTLTGGDEDWSTLESIGMWWRCAATVSAGAIVFEITDSVAGATELNFPAISTANVWTWIEIDISGVTGTSRDVITDIAIDINTGAGTAANCNFDFGYVWNVDSEVALSHDLVTDGILTVMTLNTTESAANTFSEPSEGSDYIPHYESGDDFVVLIANWSAASGIALINHQD